MDSRLAAVWEVKNMIFGIGDTAYLIEHGRYVSPVTIVKREADMYLVRFENGSGTRIRHTRLYASEAEANAGIIPIGTEKKKGFHSPYDYWH